MSNGSYSWVKQLQFQTTKQFRLARTPYSSSLRKIHIVITSIIADQTKYKNIKVNVISICDERSFKLSFEISLFTQIEKDLCTLNIFQQTQLFSSGLLSWTYHGAGTMVSARMTLKRDEKPNYTLLQNKRWRRCTHQ